jgi:hypothetical protein
MKKNIFKVGLFALLLAGSTTLFYSCSGSANKDLGELLEPEETFQDVHSDSLGIDAQLPSSMIPTTSLDAGVPFQYMNGTDEIYIIGNREPSDEAELGLRNMSKYDDKKDLKENYLNYTLDLMKENETTLTNVSSPKAIKTKNVKGTMVSVEGSRTGIPAPIAYWIATFDHKGNVYKFIFWTLASQKKDVEEKAVKTLSSLKFD